MLTPNLISVGPIQISLVSNRRREIIHRNLCKFYNYGGGGGGIQKFSLISCASVMIIPHEYPLITLSHLIHCCVKPRFYRCRNLPKTTNQTSECNLFIIGSTDLAGWSYWLTVVSFRFFTVGGFQVLFGLCQFLKKFLQDYACILEIDLAAWMNTPRRERTRSCTRLGSSTTWTYAVFV